jgi:hypothetical protein
LLRLAPHYIFEKRLNTLPPRRATQTKKKQRAEALDVLKKPQIAIKLSNATKKPAAFQEVYALQEPYVYAAIVKEKETQKRHYEIIEPTLQPDEEKHLHEIKNFRARAL